MIKWTVLCASLAAAFVVPQGAAGQFGEYNDQFRQWTQSCGQGAIGCVSWSVRLQYDPFLDPNFTRITATVANYQGAGDFADAPSWGSGGFRIDNLDWTLDLPGYCSALCTTFPLRTLLGNSGFGPRGAVGNELFYGPRGSYLSGPGYLDLQEVLWGQSRVYGCDAPAVDDGQTRGFYMWTCGGSIRFDGRVYGRAAFTDLSVADGSVVLVPEPSTYLLILTGLVGLGFVGWRMKDEEMPAGHGS